MATAGEKDDYKKIGSFDADNKNSWSQVSDPDADPEYTVW